MVIRLEKVGRILFAASRELARSFCGHDWVWIVGCRLALSPLGGLFLPSESNRDAVASVTVVWTLSTVELEHTNIRDLCQIPVVKAASPPASW